jgi:hypothetical protein
VGIRVADPRPVPQDRLRPPRARGAVSAIADLFSLPSRREAIDFKRADIYNDVTVPGFRVWDFPFRSLARTWPTKLELILCHVKGVMQSQSGYHIELDAIEFEKA